MTAKVDPAAASEILAGLDHILIVTHVRPDGDAFGSALALQEVLLANGKTAEALLPDPLPDKFNELAGRNFRTSLNLQELSRFQAVVSVDAARDDRIALGPELTRNDLTLPLLNIDHHIDNSVTAKWSCVAARAAASAELLYRILRQIPGWTIPVRAAELLLLGIVTDTGSFRFVNTTGDTLRAAAELLDLGANLEIISNAAFFSKPLKQQQFELEMLQSCVYSACEHRYLYAVIPKELFQKYDFDMRDGEAIIDLLREIAEVVIVALIYEQESGCKISMRSKDARFPVGPIARKLGGGGHQMAAGITVPDHDLAGVANRLLTEVTATLEN